MNNSGEAPLDKTKYQMSKDLAILFYTRRLLKVFFFFFFSPYKSFKISDRDGAILTLGEGPLTEATNQISKVWAF